MKTRSDPGDGVILGGLDGSNPLGFLAAVGAVSVLHRAQPDVRIAWTRRGDGWRPEISGCGTTEDDFLHNLMGTLANAPLTAFDFDSRMPCPVEKFSAALRGAQSRSSMDDRRDADFLAAMGTDLYPDEASGNFQGTHLRMVRSGDSKHQGLPVYAKDIRRKSTEERVRRAVFSPWDYQDEGFSLRWDPIEDQRYALAWKNPSEAKLGDAPATMLGANCLAVEALPLFPSLLVRDKVRTTGFRDVSSREVYFVWPVWTPRIGLDTLRSVLAFPTIRKAPASRSALARMGIEEIFESQRIKQNQYYSNLAPSRSL